MKGQDVVILLKLVSLEQSEPDPRAYPVRALADSLHVSKSEVSASLNRSLFSGLATRSSASGKVMPNRRYLFDFIVDGLKFVLPVRPGALVRGVPTAFAAPPLKGLLISAGEHIQVWPYAGGSVLGSSVDPLFASVPQAVESDARLYAYLALVDAIRIGNQREAGVARDTLSEWMLGR